MLTSSAREEVNKCDRSEFESLTNPALVTLAYCLVAIFPAVNLVYVIHINDPKESKAEMSVFQVNESSEDKVCLCTAYIRTIVSVGTIVL